MDALDVLAVAARRWYIFLTVVLLSVFAGLGLAQDRTPIYSGSGDFAVIYRPQTVVKPGQADPRQQNPMSNNGLLKASIVADLRSAESQKELGKAGVIGTDPSTAPDGSHFSLVTDRNSETVTVRAYGADRTKVTSVVQSVLEAAADRAVEIQDRVGAPTDGRLTTFITLPTQVVQLPPASGTKLIVGVVAVGVITGAALSLLADTALRKRRARRQQSDAGPDEHPMDEAEDLSADHEAEKSRTPWEQRSVGPALLGNRPTPETSSSQTRREHSPAGGTTTSASASNH